MTESTSHLNGVAPTPRGYGTDSGAHHRASRYHECSRSMRPVVLTCRCRDVRGIRARRAAPHKLTHRYPLDRSLSSQPRLVLIRQADDGSGHKSLPPRYRVSDNSALSPRRFEACSLHILWNCKVLLFSSGMQEDERKASGKRASASTNLSHKRQPMRSKSRSSHASC